MHYFKWSARHRDITVTSRNKSLILFSNVCEHDSATDLVSSIRVADSGVRRLTALWQIPVGSPVDRIVPPFVVVVNALQMLLYDRQSLLLKFRGEFIPGPVQCVGFRAFLKECRPPLFRRDHLSILHNVMANVQAQMSI